MGNRYNKEELVLAVKESLSIAQTCRKINIKPCGGNYKTIKSKIKEWDIGTSHFTGQGWNTGKRYKPFNEKIPLEKILSGEVEYKNGNSLKKRLIDEEVKEHRCENCQNDHWLGEIISIELHHIDGDNTNNRLENLQILCPNCHSMTKNYRGKNIKITYNKKVKEPIVRVKKIYYCECGKEIKKNSKYCITCSQLNQRKIKDRPNKNQLLKELENSNFLKMGKQYGVSDNTIRKWVK